MFFLDAEVVDSSLGFSGLGLNVSGSRLGFQVKGLGFRTCGLEGFGLSRL